MFKKLLEKLLLKLFFIFILIGCSKNDKIINGYFKGIVCESEENKIMKSYIFDKYTGELYFYDKKNNKFSPISLRYEAGFFSENYPEIYSLIKNNKLIIENIYHENIANNFFFKIKEIINLNSLNKKTFFINKNGKFLINKVRCDWFEPL